MSNQHATLGSIPDLVKVLRYHARKWGVFEHDVDDIVQDTIVRVWRHRDDLDPAFNVRSYAITTLRHLNQDRVRNLRRQRRAMMGYRIVEWDKYTPAMMALAWRSPRRWPWQTRS